MSARGWIVVSASVIAAAACKPDDEPTEDGVDALSASCREAVMHDDLAWLQDKIFTPSCSGFSSCHMGTALEAQGLNLEEGNTHAQLVGVSSELFPQWVRVVPGDPVNSYLMVAMGEYPGPLGDGGTMPLNNPLVCKEKREAVARWISAGAPAHDDADGGVDAHPTDAASDAPVDAASDAAP